MSADASIMDDGYYEPLEPDEELIAAYDAEIKAEREAYEKYQKALAEWQAKWPNACKKCGGWGGHTYKYDPSPAGVSLSPGCMTDFDPCEAPGCISEGNCARCGKPALSTIPGVCEEGEGPCKECGWNYNDGEPQW